MKKRVILLALIAVIIAVFFIPIEQQKTILVKSPFLNAYEALSNPLKWTKWRTDLRKEMAIDSNKISIKKDSGAFEIKNQNDDLQVKLKANSFDIDDTHNGNTNSYRYSLLPVADKLLNKSILVVDARVSILNYLVEIVWPSAHSDNHGEEFKDFMETDSLHYGFNIIKTVVPESYLLVMEKQVPDKNKFTAAAAILAALQAYMKANDIQQLHPLIAQFNNKLKDSVDVKIGFFINKEVKPSNGIQFNRMPKGGRLFAATYRGPFSKRGQAYAALKEYFANTAHQLVLLPFESYLNNKLPVSENDTVSIQENLGTFDSAPAK